MKITFNFVYFPCSNIFVKGEGLYARSSDKLIILFRSGIVYVGDIFVGVMVRGAAPRCECPHRPRYAPTQSWTLYGPWSLQAGGARPARTPGRPPGVASSIRRCWASHSEYTPCIQERFLPGWVVAVHRRLCGQAQQARPASGCNPHESSPRLGSLSYRLITMNTSH